MYEIIKFYFFFKLRPKIQIYDGLVEDINTLIFRASGADCN